MKQGSTHIAQLFLSSLVACLVMGVNSAGARIVKTEGPYGPVYRNVAEPAANVVAIPGSKKARPFLPIIVAAAQRHGVSATLIEAVVACESNFEPRAVSHAGAEGLMQLMPATARSLGLFDSFDVEGNIDTGTKHMASLLKSFQGDRRLAIAAYNAGEGSVRRAGGIPPYPETRRYVKKVEAYIASHPSWQRRGQIRISSGAATPAVRMLRDGRGRLLLTNLPQQGSKKPAKQSR